MSEITARIGDIEVSVPEGRYDVDARVRIGDLDSDFGRVRGKALIGAVAYPDCCQPTPGDAKRLYVRLGIGDIRIRKMTAARAAVK
ncbi:MAG: hypothetical protein HY235_29250 [Acidobacteria bacterium]|nr:hypothetical protein [Acidobacteriota bacterium]